MLLLYLDKFSEVKHSMKDTFFMPQSQQTSFSKSSVSQSYEPEASGLSVGGMIMLNLEEFLEEIKPPIKWSARVLDIIDVLAAVDNWIQLKS